ncbi:Acetyltransferase [Bacillus cytotoxicus]|nr:Acetyltransferase [Bacillus cytotoxicus]
MTFTQQNNASEYIKNKVIQYNMSVLPDEVKQPMEQVSFLFKRRCRKNIGRNNGNDLFLSSSYRFFMGE